MWNLNNFKYIKTMKNFNLFKSLLIMLCMVLMGGGSVMAQNWVRCTQVSDLLSGGVFIIGYEKTANPGVIVPMRTEGTLTETKAGYIYSGTTSNQSTSTTIDMSSVSVSETPAYEVVIEPSTVVKDAVTIKIGKYFIGNEDSKNNAKLFAEESDNTAFTPSVESNGVFTLKIGANQTYNYLQYNSSSSSPRFAVYKGTQQNVVLYKKAVSSVVVSGTPIKTEYQAGEEFLTNGLVVIVNYVDGTNRTVKNGVKWTIDPAALTAGLTEVRVKATADGVESASHPVNVVVSAVKTLTKIEVSGTPEELWKGDAFNHNGITVTATWDDGTESDVTSESEFSTPDMSTAGTKTVEVTYKEKTTTYDVVVKTIANTKETAYTVDKARDLIDAGKDLGTYVYVKGIVSEIVYPYSTQYGNITFNISADGNTTGNQFQFYRTKNTLDGVAYNPGIEEGREVVGYGELYKHESTYEFKANNYLVSYTGSNKNATLVAQQGGYYYATFSSENPVKFENAEVYAVNVSDDDALVLNSVESKLVPANTGVLIKSTAKSISYYATLCSVEDKIENNLLKASSVTMSASDKNYKLAYNDYTYKTGLGFYYGTADGGVFNAKEGGAYLAVPSDQTSARCFTFDDVETGINTIEVADEANTAAEVYDLAGRKVSKAQKGLYIVNGVKVIK